MIMVPGEVRHGARPRVSRAGRPATAPRGGRAPDAAGAAARRARRLRDELHPARAGGAAGQHVAHRRRARRRTQQPLSQDAPLRNCPRAAVRRRSGAVVTPSTTDDIPTPALVVDVRGARAQHRPHGAVLRRRDAAGCVRMSRRTRRPRSRAGSSPPGSCVGLTCATVLEAEAVAGLLRRHPASPTRSSVRTSAAAWPRWPRVHGSRWRSIRWQASRRWPRPRAPRASPSACWWIVNVGQMRCGVAAGRARRWRWPKRVAAHARASSCAA